MYGMRPRKAWKNIMFLALFTTMLLFFYVQSDTIYKTYIVDQERHAARSTTPGEVEETTAALNEVVNGNTTINRNDNIYFSLFATEDDIEEFSVRLPQSLPNYKNPCWMERIPENFSYITDNLYSMYLQIYPNFKKHDPWDEKYASMQKMIESKKNNTEKDNWRIRCFPYFFLLGFTKCGTTDLHESLSLLPSLFRAMTKEPAFWNFMRLEPKNKEMNLPVATLADYLDLFDMAAEEIRKYVVTSEDGTQRHPGIIGDFDPRTIWGMSRWDLIKGNEKRDEPKYLTPHHLYHLNPKTKFMVLLRDPVERALSHYRFFKRNRNQTVEAATLHKDMKKVIHKLHICFKEKSLRACVYLALKKRTLSIGSLIASIYYVFIEDWIKVFPREQFLFIKAEDYFKNRTATIVDVANFLEFDDAIPDDIMRRISEMLVINTSTEVEIFKESRKLLQNFFQPFNKRLSVLLDNEKWLWEN